MRTQKLTFLSTLILILFMGVLKAQNGSSQAYWVHEDVVKPSMIGQYESICKELTDNMKKYNIQEFNVIVSNTADNRYLWVSPINGMADIEKPIFKTLSEKMGEEKMGDLFDRMDKCYDIEQNYVIHLDKELSYMPGGITQTPEGQEYRKFHYYHYTPSNRAEVNKKVKAIKNLFESKGSKLDYRLYRSGFGTRGAFYMVAIAAKDEADYAGKIAANNELMGEEWQNAYSDFISSLEKYEAFEGRMRPDMGYAPK
ncbi:MAG: hypothetical protein WBM98_14840 [Maribacter sp.]|uniref:hypothetical protein n=1 Tax=Maribacter sp. TaxID=1897614 RepID=UPI003C70C481